MAEKIYNNKELSSSYNFGPVDNDAKTVKWIVESLIDKWGGDTKWKIDNSKNPHEANYLKLDTTKARTLLNWGQRWSLNKSLDKIVEWQKHWLDNKSIKDITLQQINEYME